MNYKCERGSTRCSHLWRTAPLSSLFRWLFGWLLVRDGRRLRVTLGSKQRREHLLQSTSEDIGLLYAFEQNGILLAQK